MTEDDARKVARNCIDIWPNGTREYIWQGLVAGWEYGRAMQALGRLRAKAIKTPVPGQLQAEYDALTSPVDGRGIRWNGDEISLAEYLERVQLRATNGSHEAQAEMDRWTKYLAPKESA